MKYYSEKTKKMYDSVEQVEAAELEYDKAHAVQIAKQKERKARAEEIASARKVVVEAQKKYNELLNKFVKDYGSYHATYTDGDVETLDSIIYKIFGL